MLTYNIPVPVFLLYQDLNIRQCPKMISVMPQTDLMYSVQLHKKSGSPLDESAGLPKKKGMQCLTKLASFRSPGCEDPGKLHYAPSVFLPDSKRIALNLF